MSNLKMFDPTQMVFHPAAEKITQHLCTVCENNSPTFFRMMTTYALGKIATQMRVSIKTHTNKALPLNVYAVALAPSGAGKTRAMNLLEEEVSGLFHDRFKDELLPWATEQNLAKLSVDRAAKNNSDPDHEFQILINEFKSSGQWLSAFDSATPAALKQFRHKLLLANAGSLNFEIDEIGDNLTGNAEAFSKLLELYDKGSLKESLTKNTKENTRLSEIKGQTPTNLIMFGTPSSLLDGAKKEDEFNAMLEKGYARRSLFGFTREVSRDLELTAEEIYARNTSHISQKFIDDFAEHLLTLADPINYNRRITLDRDEEILHIEYNLYCRERASKMSEFDVVKRIEMEHRWFKAIKVAAIYAFIDGSSKVTTKHLYNAFALVEDSGEAFSRLLIRDRPYVKLAKYLGEIPRQVTQVELVEDLPFYKGNQQQKTEMLTMAIAYGYQNNIIIKKIYTDGIEFLKGESLKKTDLDKLTVAYSQDLALNYNNDTVTWDNIATLTQMPDMHWTTHHVLDMHRCEDKMIPGFNLLVIDVDGGVPMQTAQTLLSEYKSIFYTTKRHGLNGEDRFRIVMPMEFTLKLDGLDFKEFMRAIYDWLPFPVDDDTGQRSRKWMSNAGTLIENDGVLFNPLEFIPKTSKNEQRKARLMDQQSLSNLERWFVNNTGMGNRSNQLIKYALLLVDSGKTLAQTEQAVFALNEKIPDKLPEDEIVTTIMRSAQKAYNKLPA